MNNSKCHKCGLVNPLGDLACRRCGGILGLSVSKSFTEQKTTAPKYLFLAPFLLLAIGLGIWYSQIKNSAVDSIHLDKEEWHALTMDSKVNPKDPPRPPKPYDPFKGLRQQEELRKLKLEPVTPFKAPVYQPPPPANQPW